MREPKEPKTKTIRAPRPARVSAKAEADTLSLERLVFFSDAVFAIAITLLAIELRPPHVGDHGSLGQALALLAPKLAAYLVSFAVIGSMWVEHHRIFRYIRAWDDGLIWRNMVLLLSVAFIPFPTAVYSENRGSGAALALYALSIGAVGLAKVWVWKHAARDRRLIHPPTPRLVVESVGRRAWAIPLTCLVAAALGLLDAPGAYGAFALIPVWAWMLERAA